MKGKVFGIPFILIVVVALISAVILIPSILMYRQLRADIYGVRIMQMEIEARVSAPVIVPTIEPTQVPVVPTKAPVKLPVKSATPSSVSR